MSPYLLPVECALPDESGVRCVQLLVKLRLKTRDDRSGEKGQEKPLIGGDTGGFFVSRFGSDETAAKT